MIAHQKLCVRYCHKGTGAGQTERVITRNIIPRLLFRGSGKALAKLCFVVFYFLFVWFFFWGAGGGGFLPDALTSSGPQDYIFMYLCRLVLAPPHKEFPTILYCHTHDLAFNYL